MILLLFPSLGPVRLWQQRQDGVNRFTCKFAALSANLVAAVGLRRRISEWQTWDCKKFTFNILSSSLIHYQGGIDFNTVNNHRTLGMCFLVFTGNRDDILNAMTCRDHNIQYTPWSIGSVLGNTALGTVFLDTLPRANIRNTSSQGKHWQCFSNDAGTMQSQCRHLPTRQNLNMWAYTLMLKVKRPNWPPTRSLVRDFLYDSYSV